jgi:hypothetical protein
MALQLASGKKQTIIEIEGKKIRVSSLDQVLFPNSGLTKAQTLALSNSHEIINRHACVGLTQWRSP